MCPFSSELRRVFLIAFIWINLILSKISGTDLTKLPVQCSILEFRCASNQSCIEYPLLCDGLKDCPDGSDETEKECAKMSCSSNQFRCLYGGCINLSEKCDGRTDCADNSDETNAECPPITNEVVTAKYCNLNQFQCLSSKNCVDKRLLCDGKGDCKDNSDETARQCKHNICPSSKFRCEYGACISANSKCDRKKDCLDGSDEFQKTCLPRDLSGLPGGAIGFGIAKKPNSDHHVSLTCTLPNNSCNFQMEIICPKETPQCATGSGKVKWNTEVKYRCKEGYGTLEKGNEFVSVCQKGSWLPSFNTCKRTCKTLKPENVDLTCSFKGLEVNCTGKMLDGTSVRPRCKAFHHEIQPIHYKQIHCESNGEWTDELFRCVPDCGIPIKNMETVIAHASEEKYGEAPWYVAIYDVTYSKPIQICGGTLISPDLVVSAAHCFFNESIENVNNADNYEIAVSKYTRQYSKQDNRFTKIYKIREIIMPQKVYTGASTHYASDIAILWIRERISINRAVLPACVPRTRGNQFNPVDGSLGKLTGLGVTENETSSEFIRTAQLTLINRDKCITSLPDDSKNTVTLDKFCGGFANDSEPLRGDDGGGYLFRDPDLGVHFLQGIVSIRTGGYDSPSITLFTSISSYLDWMNQVQLRVQKFIRDELSVDCGIPIKNVETLIAYGNPEKYGEAPWYVAIYNVKTSNRPLICGGTLISPYLVISAAHCFFDESIQQVNNASNYEIAVSKYTRQYSKRDNHLTKIYKIREIILPPKIYTGESTHYASDIAILWVRERISISRVVLPACVPWTQGGQFNPGDGSMGKLTGFGETENETSSEFLLTAQLPFISRQKCINALDDDFKDIVTLDKFCGGSENGSGARKGDSGGGFLFQDPDLGVYFLQGVVSIRRKTSSSMAVFTSITSYLDWINQVRMRVQNSTT